MIIFAPLILKALAAITIAAVVVCVILKWNDIIDWFKGREKLYQKDKHNVAIVIKEKMQSGDYKVVQGIFNKKTSEFKDSKAYEAKELDEELQACEELTIFE